MATVTAISSGASLATTINYITNKAEIVMGIDCSSDCDRAIEQMKITKEMYGKIEGAEHYHYVQSFAEDDNISAELANEIGQRIAKELFPGHEGVVATHGDTTKKHNHFDFNSVNWETGLKLQFGPPELQAMKDLSDKICLEYGLSVIDKTQTIIGEFRSYDKREWKAREKSKERGIPFIKDIVYGDVVKCLETATNKVDFINDLYKLGYKTEWSDSVKNITFTDQEGKCYRAGTLGKSYSDPRLANKENLLAKLEQNLNKVEVIQEPIIEKIPILMTSEEMYKKINNEIRAIENNNNDNRNNKNYVNTVSSEQLAEMKIIKTVIFERYNNDKRTAKANKSKEPIYVITDPNNVAAPSKLSATEIFANAIMGKPGLEKCVTIVGMDNKIIQTNSQIKSTGGGMAGIGGGGRSLPKTDERSIETSRPITGGGLTNSGKSDEDRIRDLMDKGMSREKATELVLNPQQ